MRYEDRLAALFARREESSLTLIAMAHIGGFADRVQRWLAAARTEDAYAQIWLHDFGALQTGDVDLIEARLLNHARLNKLGQSSSADSLDIDLGRLADPLILIDRADLLPVLHDRSLQRHGAGGKSLFTTTAALSLAAASDWEPALRILESARRASGDIDIPRIYEDLLWKYAYLHRQVETVMPVLSETPFSAAQKHLVEYRKWLLKAYQIRAGLPGALVPIIEHEDQPMGYDEAAAMQIAALAHDPSAADYVRDLRRTLRPRTIEIIHIDREIAIESTNFPQAFSTAEAQIAARRKDYEAVAALARVPSKDILVDPPSVVIDALLDEGDWRGAAMIATEHDPRKRPVLAGFDDTRAHDYVVLHNHLALAAAREGDDHAAADFLAEAKAVDRAEVPRDEGTSSDDAFLWLETLLAGLAENLLPRKYLYVLTSAFRSSY
jgi:hypothetical protein